MTDLMLTKNTNKLRREVAAHVDAATDAARTAAWAADATGASAPEGGLCAARAAVRLRQRDLLLRLIVEAPVVENYQ